VFELDCFVAKRLTGRNSVLQTAAARKEKASL
jgi:hypothetical protein